MPLHLDFSIGPVQSFVKQSRRTRDLWGSSYLLSHLAERAIREIRANGGKIVRPVGAGDVFGPATARPYGTAPNQFRVEASDEEQGAAFAAAAHEAVHDAWSQVCESVWNCFVRHAEALGRDVRRIWNRQVRAFPEISWVVGDDPGLLARRKHWRTDVRDPEPGDKCLVMPEWQEISGWIQARPGEAEKQNRFWKAITDQKGMGPLDLEPEERLCAMALVKRLYPKPRVSRQAIGIDLDAAHWLSTPYIAAVPWLARVGKAATNAAQRYAERVKESVPKDALLKKTPQLQAFESCRLSGLERLDPAYFRFDSLGSKKHTPLKRECEGRRGELLRLLEDLQKTKDGNGALGGPGSYYALILADGDRLGEVVSKLDLDAVAEALGKYAEDIPQALREVSGSVVYAGGDDLLAMAPLEGALQCAERLAREYREAFLKAAGKDAGATLSAAVVFAHIRAPLTRVLSEAHDALDKHAKDENGRNSLCASVYGKNGSRVRWTTAWEERGEASSVERVNALVERLRNTENPEVSSSLIYRLHRFLTRLTDTEHWKPGDWIPRVEDLDLRLLVRAEIDGETAANADDADELAALLTEILRRRSNRPPLSSSEEFGLDGLLLARFLAAGGLEGDH